jgi:hypothetical protein
VKFYWHIHHDLLVEPSDNIEARIEYIKVAKPESEVPRCLRLLAEVKGELPYSVVSMGIACREAEEKYHQCMTAERKAYAAMQKSAFLPEPERPSPDMMLLAWQYACEATRAATRRWNESLIVFQAILDRCADEIGKLHDAECPCCPWNGKTIFPEAQW